MDRFAVTGATVLSGNQVFAEVSHAELQTRINTGVVLAMIGSMTLTLLLADTERMTTAMMSHSVSASEGFRKGGSAVFTACKDT